jgi:hypothetical protein
LPHQQQVLAGATRQQFQSNQSIDQSSQCNQGLAKVQPKVQSLVVQAALTPLLLIINHSFEVDRPTNHSTNQPNRPTQQATATATSALGCSRLGLDILNIPGCSSSRCSRVVGYKHLIAGHRAVDSTDIWCASLATKGPLVISPEK